MAKVVKKIKLQIPGGKATPAPPVGTVLGPAGVNIGDFVNKFNEQTRDGQDETWSEEQRRCQQEVEPQG